MRVQVSGRQFAFPQLCACCGVPAETELPVSASRTTGKRVVRTKTNTWNFPYCRSCLAHVAAWDQVWGCGVVSLVLLTAAFLGLTTHWIYGAITLVGGSVLLAIVTSSQRKAARAMCSSACIGTERAVQYVEWSGTIQTFHIASEPYALAFMRSNASKLVNLSPETARRLSETSEPSRESTPPARALAAQPDAADVFLKWVQKVEGAKGPAARRAAVQVALADPLLAARRDEFIRAAAGIEVRTTLDKVDTLKTPAARRRHLTDALSALRNDSAPDELQAEEIACLEDALEKLSQD